MNILWFVNIPFPKVSEAYHLGKVNLGGWMPSLADKLKNGKGIQLSIAWATNKVNKIEKVSDEYMDYYLFPDRKLPLVYKKGISYKAQINSCRKIIDKVNPDIIEIYGTENFYGLVSEFIDIPVIINIQGVLNEYIKYYYGQLSLKTILLSPRIIKGYVEYNQKCGYEKDIFGINKIYSGRTQWDNSILYDYTTSFDYYSIYRILREPFYSLKWKLSKKIDHTVYSTSKMQAYKGTHILIKALAIVKTEFPDVRLRIAGDVSFSYGYGRYLHKLTKNIGLANNVVFIGSINAEKVADELKKAHVFVLPSLIDNSPNSLGEAQLVGTPTVASYTGGVPSMVENNKTGLLYSRGDHTVLASHIIKLFKDDSLAEKLSRNTKEMASERHDPDKICESCIQMYKNIIKKSSENNGRLFQPDSKPPY